jgi:hypothetical protein
VILLGLDKLINAINTIRKKYDCPIAVTGPEQVGKSTFSLQVLIEMYYKGGSIRKFLEKYVAYVNSELEEKIVKMEHMGGIIGDEAIRWAWRRNWMKEDNKQLGELWKQIGFKRLVAFFNLSVFWNLDNIYRNERVKFWIHVFEKGHAIIYQPDANPFVTDVWYQKDIMKKMSFMSQFDPWKKRLKLLSRNKLFFDYIQFDPLPPEWKDVYDEISQGRKLDQENRKPNKVMNQRDTLIAVLCNDGYTESQVGNLMAPKMPQRTVNACKARGEELASSN